MKKKGRRRRQRKPSFQGKSFNLPVRTEISNHIIKAARNRGGNREKPGGKGRDLGEKITGSRVGKTDHRGVGVDKNNQDINRLSRDLE